MLHASVYKIRKKGYLIFGHALTTTGLLIGIDPFFRIEENEISTDKIASAIKASLVHDHTHKVPHPKDWEEFGKEMSQKIGFKSKVLNSSTTFLINIKKRDGELLFIPLKHAEEPDQGFLNFGDDKDVNVVVPDNASDQEIFNALEIAFGRAE